MQELQRVTQCTVNSLNTSKGLAITFAREVKTPGFRATQCLTVKLDHPVSGGYKDGNLMF
jgi:hypothetical protein